MLEVCIKLNVRCVSAYAFSIENFKRSPAEVDALMDLAEEKLRELCQQGCVPLCLLSACVGLHTSRDILDKYGIKLVVVGHRDMLPERVRIAAEKAENMTKDHDRCARILVRNFSPINTDYSHRAIFNLCMPYTSRDEITTAVQSTIQERLREDNDDT